MKPCDAPCRQCRCAVVGMILGIVLAIEHVPINKLCEFDDFVCFVNKVNEMAAEYFGLTRLLRIGT
ncbi:MAG: hypothetical protein LBJ67_19355 [Planctomycetaceae bacterium]|nr:hypothetical protein [Planctomycetaceae bacterium]